MKSQKYHEVAFRLQAEGKISDDVFWVILENADAFCDDDDDEEWGISNDYAEIDYDDRIWDDPEAIDGSRWDDMNYLHYRER